MQGLQQVIQTALSAASVGGLCSVSCLSRPCSQRGVEHWVGLSISL